MDERRHSLTQRLETDPESVERDLFKLVLTVVELVRQLVAYLPAREDREAWGVSKDWTAAVAFARRFAY